MQKYSNGIVMVFFNSVLKSEGDTLCFSFFYKFSPIVLRRGNYIEDSFV